VAPSFAARLTEAAVGEQEEGTASAWATFWSIHLSRAISDLRRRSRPKNSSKINMHHWVQELEQESRHNPSRGDVSYP